MASDSSGDLQLLPLQEYDAIHQSKETTPTANDEKQWKLLSSLQGYRLWDVATMTSAMIAVFLGNLAISTMAPFYPKEAEKKHVSTAVVGVIISSTPLMAALICPFSGFIMPRVGFVVPAFVGPLLTGIAYLSLGFVDRIPSSWGFIVASLLLRMLEGVGSALLFTVSTALIARLYPSHVGALYGVFELSCGLGFSFGYLLGGILYKVGGFKLPFIVVGSCLLLFTIPYTLLVWRIKERDSKSETSGISVKTTVKVLTDFTVIFLVLGFVSSVFAICYYNPILEPFLRRQFNFNSVQTSLVFVVQPLSFMVTSVIVGLLVDKLGYHRYFSVIGLFLTATVLIIMGTIYDQGIVNPYIIGVAFVILGASAAMGTVPVFGDLLKTSEQYLGEGVDGGALSTFMSGLLPFSYYSGEFWGVLAGGILGNSLSLPMTSVVVGELVLTEALLLLGVTIICKYTQRHRDREKKSQL